MGGLGYIEDGVMPKLFRDMLVLPIWEGSEILLCWICCVLMGKSKGFAAICKEITRSAENNEEHGKWMKDELNKLIFFAELMTLTPKLKQAQNHSLKS